MQPTVNQKFTMTVEGSERSGEYEATYLGMVPMGMDFEMVFRVQDSEQLTIIKTDDFPYSVSQTNPDEVEIISFEPVADQQPPDHDNDAQREQDRIYYSDHSN